jgi:peptidoglycan/LPS O-acetylase OafA/YrhL
VALGTYSYAIYIFHLPLKHALRALLGARLAVGSVAVDAAFIAGVSLGAMLAARSSALLIERPFLRLKDRWAPRSPG